MFCVSDFLKAAIYGSPWSIRLETHTRTQILEICHHIGTACPDHLLSGKPPVILTRGGYQSAKSMIASALLCEWNAGTSALSLAEDDKMILESNPDSAKTEHTDGQITLENGHNLSVLFQPIDKDSVQIVADRMQIFPSFRKSLIFMSGLGPVQRGDKDAAMAFEIHKGPKGGWHRTLKIHIFDDRFKTNEMRAVMEGLKQTYKPNRRKMPTSSL